MNRNTPTPSLSDNLNLLEVQQEKTIDYLDLLENFPYRPTLFLGLGGTGCAAVVKTKQILKRVFGSVKGSDVAEEIPSMYGFRAFETNMGESYNLDPQEITYLCVSEVRRFLEQYGEDPFYRDWLPQQVDVTSIRDGAGGFRALGRLALSYNMHEFADAITSARQQVLAPDNRCLREFSPVVYVFCSLSGGTGSGMLLDVCFYLREYLPSFRIVGFVALLEGATTASQTARKNAKVGCYAAIKELNTFMTGNVPVPACQPGKEFKYPIGEVTSRYSKPFDYCFLLGSRTDDRESLQTQDEITSFISRCAYVMSACQFQGGTSPDFFGIAMNRLTELDQIKKGFKTAFLVPALGQVHFPLGDAVDWLCLRITNDLLHYLSGGFVYEGNEDAALFATQQGLNRYQLEATVKHDENGTPIEARRYDGEIEERFRTMAVIHQQGKAILNFGEMMLTTRLTEIQKEMQPAANACLAGCRAALHQQVDQMLVNPKFLYQGALDFLSDLREIVLLEQRNMAKHDQDHLSPHMASINFKWEPVRKFVEDVATARGPIDRIRDAWNRQKCCDWYITFLNEAESALFDKATNDVACQVLLELKKEIDNLETDLKVLFDTHVSGAINVIQQRRHSLAQKLLDQERARGERPEEILSINVITQEVREKWMKSHREFWPDSVLVSLGEPGWNPKNWLTLRGSSEAPQPKERLIADDVVRRVNGLLESWRTRSIADVVNESQGLRGTTPAEYLASTIFTLAKPQLRLNQKSVLGISPEPIPAICGITDELAQELKRHPTFARLKHLGLAQTFEKNRITYFAAFLPVATAGIADLEIVYQKEYQNWLKETLSTTSTKERALAESEVRKFHCFPGSVDEFSDPVAARAVETELVLFSKALALSKIVPVNPEDQAQMKKKTGPKGDKLYALFRVGKADFWIWPFFTPKANQDMENPTRLGSNIVAAYSAFKKDQAIKDEAAKWVGWFDGIRTTLFTLVEIQNQIQAVINDMPAKETDPDRKKLWADIKNILLEWKDELS